MIESYENNQQEALSKKSGTGDDTTAGVQGLLEKLGLPLLPPRSHPDGAEETPDGSDACRTGHFGRVPLTKSTILGTAYRRSLTHYRPWPPVVLPKPLEFEVINSSGCSGCAAFHHPRHVYSACVHWVT